MKLTAEDKKRIRKLFHEMSEVGDFLKLLNLIKGSLYGEHAQFITLRQLNYHAHPRFNPKRYTQFEIPKKSGGTRIIHAPNVGLKVIQGCLNVLFQTLYEPVSVATGFVPGRSIVDNASIHAHSLYVYNIDLCDFFPSIDQARIWGRLKKAPFNLERSPERLKIAALIAGLCCTNLTVKRFIQTNQEITQELNVLPQGAPTSPVISNIICQRLDEKLIWVARKYKARYSRYADDITFSSSENIYADNHPFIIALRDIIHEQRFSINAEKVRLQHHGHRQMVTGLVVNQQPNVTKYYLKTLRQWLYYWEHYGYDRASKYFQQAYRKEKGATAKGQADMKNVLGGKLDYLRMVKGNTNRTYLSYKRRFLTLAGRNLLILDVVETWRTNGIAAAMELYYGGPKEVNTMEVVDFLANLLNHNRLLPDIKEEIFKLTSSDLKKFGMSDPEILKRIELLEKKWSEMSAVDNGEYAEDLTKTNSGVNVVANEEKVSQRKTKKEVKTSDPSILPRFLLTLHEESIFKVTTHTVDSDLKTKLLEDIACEEYNYEVHQKIMKEKIGYYGALFKVPGKFVNKIRAYLLGESERQGEMAVGWGMEEVKQWCLANPGKFPNPGSDLKQQQLVFREIISMPDGRKAPNFLTVMQWFKESIEFRDTNALDVLIKRENIAINLDLQHRIGRRVKFNEQHILQGVRFYSDVDRVMRIYKTILKIFIQHMEKDIEARFDNTIITVRLVEDRNEAGIHIISLVINDNYSKFSKSATSFGRFGDDFTNIIENARDLCDVIFSAEFANNEYWEYSLVPSTNKKKLIYFEGISFELKFLINDGVLN